MLQFVHLGDIFPQKMYGIFNNLIITKDLSEMQRSSCSTYIYDFWTLCNHFKILPIILKDVHPGSKILFSIEMLQKQMAAFCSTQFNNVVQKLLHRLHRQSSVPLTHFHVAKQLQLYIFVCFHSISVLDTYELQFLFLPLV